MSPLTIHDLQTPALLVEAQTLDHNLTTMAVALPGARLRPHVKAHKCTALARRQGAVGHRNFTCATVREVEGMAAAGLGDDLLLANEVADARRLGALDARITVAVDSEATIAAAAAGGVREVLIDVNVGLPRCGCAPDEGHVVGLDDRATRTRLCGESMQLLLAAHRQVGGQLISAGGTGTYDCNVWANEIQAGSYALMDTAYAALDLPFRRALFVLATLISVNQRDGYAVADCGLKALGMDHGNPSIDGGAVWFCSDEHVTFSLADGAGQVEGASLPTVGDLIRVWPAHVDPTVACHERMHVAQGDDIADTWAVDLRGW